MSEFMPAVTFGDQWEGPCELGQSTRIVFRTRQLELKWSHCSNSADFLSQFYAGVVAHSLTSAQVQDISHSIAYMANELIENALKFRDAGDVEISAGLVGENFVLRIVNWISRETSRRFQTLLEEITNGDPGELLIQRIEANAEGEGSGSGLGILTLMNDYGVRFTWRFEPSTTEGDERVLLDTIARLPLPS